MKRRRLAKRHGLLRRNEWDATIAEGKKINKRIQEESERLAARVDDLIVLITGARAA